MRKVFLSELAEYKLLQLSEYLIEKWSLKTRDSFIQKLPEKINQISSQPIVARNLVNLMDYINVW